LAEYIGDANVALRQALGKNAFGVNLEELGMDAFTGKDSEGNLEFQFEMNRASNNALLINHFVHTDRMLTVVGPGNVVVTK